MAIAHDASSSVSDGGLASGSPVTLSHTTGSGSDRLLWVVVGTSGGSVPGGVTATYNGVSMTAAFNFVGSTYFRLAGFYLVAPASGAHNVVVSCTSGFGDEYAVGAVSYTGVDQTTPIGTPATADGTGATATVNASSASGELVVDGFYTGWATASVGASQTQRWKQEFVSSVAGGASDEAGAATVTMSWTRGSTGGFDAWLSGAVALKPASSLVTATASFTEPNETLSSAASHPVTGSATFTEANETVSSAASHPVIGTAEFTEAVETLSSAVTVQWFAAADFTEPNETLDGAADHPVIGSALEDDEPNETLSSDVAVQNLGVVEVTEANETLSSDVTVEGGVDCVAAFTEPNETLSSDTTVLATGSLTQTEPNETLSSDVTHPVIGTAEFTEANETLSSAGTVETLGVVNVTEAVETLSSDVTHPVLGTALQNTEANEALTGAATVAISATLNATEPNETLSSLTGVAIVADAAFTEPNEQLGSMVDTGVGFVYARQTRINLGIGVGL